eukprot:COSAG01_NODE_5361_length_4310_cov_8.729280_3_plen_176_part_00
MLDALVERKEHVPFRDSVLTKLLADALTGNSMTTIITTTSPAMRNAAESKSTLAYGARARKIKTKPVVNDSDEKWRVRELEAEVQRLKALAAAGSSSAPGGGGGGAKVVYRDRGKSGGMYAMMMRMMMMMMMMLMLMRRRRRRRRRILRVALRHTPVLNHAAVAAAAAYPPCLPS